MSVLSPGQVTKAWAGLYPYQLSPGRFIILSFLGTQEAKGGSDFVFMRQSYPELLWARPQAGACSPHEGHSPGPVLTEGPAKCLRQGLGCTTDIYFRVCEWLCPLSRVIPFRGWDAESRPSSFHCVGPGVYPLAQVFS